MKYLLWCILCVLLVFIIGPVTALILWAVGTGIAVLEVGCKGLHTAAQNYAAKKATGAE